MNKINFYLKAMLLSMSPVLFFIACTDDAPIAQSTPAGNIIGKIRNNRGKPAGEVPVLLAPVQFNPYTQNNTGSVDTVFTDHNGNYAFTLNTSGFFNIIAGNSEYSSFDDSIYSSDNMTVAVRTSTLKTPGSISGIALHARNDDPRNIVILALGTGTYTIPSDSLGTFTLPSLAEGIYHLRFLTTKKGYGTIDTTIQVLSGESTTIPRKIIPFKGLPSMGTIRAEYDRNMMKVTLSWLPIDTTNASGIYLFRNTGIAEKPFALLKKSDTAFIDDVLLLNPDTLIHHDTLQYQVAVCAADGTIGGVGTAPAVRMTSILTRGTAIPLEGKTERAPVEGEGTVAIRDNDIYLGGEGWIVKFNLGGDVAEYCDDHCVNDSDNVTGMSTLFTGSDGDIYYWYAMENTPFRRLSSGLNVEASLQPDDTANAFFWGDFWFVSNENNLLYRVFRPLSEDNSLRIQRLDRSLAEIDSFSFPFEATNYQFKALALYKDTLIFRTSVFDSASKWKINLVPVNASSGSGRILDIGPVLRGRIPSPENGYYVDKLDILPDGRKIVSVRTLGSSGSIAFLLDRENKLQARCWIRGRYYSFDGTDRLCIYNRYPQRCITIYKIEW